MKCLFFGIMIGNKTVVLEEVDSTNRYLMDWIGREKIEEGTMVIASYQSAGRGMDNNTWESLPGLNLTFSFVLYPTFLAVDQQFYLNKAISLGLADLVRNEAGGSGDVTIKWPNDIYIGDRKVAGILIQNGVKGSVFEFAVIGIGLNVNQEAFKGDALNPVSLKMATGKDINLQELTKRLVDLLEGRLKMLREGGKKQMDADYLNTLYRFRQVHSYTYKDKKIQARIIDVSRYGQLILEIPGEKVIECDFKEIRFER